MKKMMILLMIVIALALANCSGITVIDSTANTTLYTTEITTEFTTEVNTEETTETLVNPIIFDYLNETPPVSEAKLFGPSGYLSNEDWHWHGTPVFSPDGKEMYWSKYIKASNEIETWFTKENDSNWGEPEKLTIDGVSGAINCPVFADGGNELYFLNLDGMTFTIYKVTRSGDTWTNPEAIVIDIPEGKVLGWSFSIAENKNIYFLLWDLNGLEHQKIYRAIYNNGQYGSPQPIDILDVGSDGVGGPSIALDESYIIFDSIRSDGSGLHDLYVSFKNDLGEFTTPINLGSQVNTNEEDAGATISADGQYLFYTTLKATDLGYNPYWIRIDELEAFKME